MNNQIKITLPEMAPDQTDWKLYREYQNPIGRDPWPWHHRLIWRVLMHFHDRAERLWHWIWNIAQPFAEPRMRYKPEYLEIKVMKKIGNTVYVDSDSAAAVENGDLLFSSPPIDKVLESDLTE